MKFFSRLFKKKSRETTYTEEDFDWDDILLRRDKIDIRDKASRRAYVMGALEQIRDAEEECRILTYEYETVTSYLTDMEEIEALPSYMREDLVSIASHLVGMEEKQVVFEAKKERLTEEEYLAMERLEDVAEDAIAKLSEAEKYQKLVKEDLRKVAGEKMAYEFRQEDLQEEIAGYSTSAKICFAVMAAALIILFLLQMLLELDVRLGYGIVVVMNGLLILNMFMKQKEGKREIVVVNRDLNRIITLQNTVKIRYVNNKNLLDYYRLKYHVPNAAKLQSLWEKYQEDKKDREELEKAVQDMGFYQKELIRMLRKSRIKDPSVWLHQAKAITDEREMVELRHEYLTRRAALRDQLAHNKELSRIANEELKAISRDYPEYAGEILQMIDDFERRA